MIFSHFPFSYRCDFPPRATCFYFFCHSFRFCTSLYRNSFHRAKFLSVIPCLSNVFPNLCDGSYIVPRNLILAASIFPFLYIRWPTMKMNERPPAVYSLLKISSTSQAPAQYWTLHFNALASESFWMRFWRPRYDLQSTRSWLIGFLFCFLSAHSLCRSMTPTFLIAEWDRNRCYHLQCIQYDRIQCLVSSGRHLVLRL